MRFRAYVIEPQEIFVDHLRQLLAEVDMDVTGVSSQIDAKAISEADPELVFLDADYGLEDPRSAVAAVRKAARNAIICVVTQRRRKALGAACLRAGASCVLSKQSTDGELVEALRFALAGGAYADPRVDRAA